METEGSLPRLKESAIGPYPEPDEFSQHLLTLFLRSILILSSQLGLGLQSCLFPSRFSTKISYTFLIAPIRATYLAHLILLELITLIIFGEAYKLRRSSLCSLLQPPVTSSLSVPTILLSTLFSNILSLRSSLSMRDQVAQDTRRQDPYTCTFKLNKRDIVISSSR